MRSEQEALDILEHLRYSANFWMPRCEMSFDIRYVFVGDPSLALLGEGSYGKVYKAKDKLTGQAVAIKQVNLEGLSDRELELIRQEIELCFVI